MQASVQRAEQHTRSCAGKYDFHAEPVKNDKYGAEHFAVGKSIPENGARLAVCAPDSLQQLEDALQIIKGILK